MQRNKWGGLCYQNEKEYNAWKDMKRRCLNKGNKYYHRYGGRGIRICDRWANSFVDFFKDMGQAPTSKHSLDRINPDGPYSPENCRWATATQQSRNYSNNVSKTGYKGVSQPGANGRYHARISVKRKSVHLGTFDTLEEAVSARAEGERIYWGAEQ